ncbi:MAG TPA: hypothetical protein V6C58_05720 [Allocoleopsis sp.]
MNVFGYDTSFRIKKKIFRFKVNEDIIKNFIILRNYNTYIKQPFKAKAYSNAVLKLKDLDYEISLENVKKLKDTKIVGNRLYEKIVEFLKSGKMNAVEEVYHLEQTKELLKIKGFGNSTLNFLNKMGIYSVDDLRKNKHLLKLNKIQQLGLKYYSDLSIPIPRGEVLQIYEKLLPAFSSLESILVGSYRRNRSSSNDVDIVISCDFSECTERIRSIVSKYPQYVSTLIFGKIKYSFLIKFFDIVRQVDLLVVPKRSYYTAIFHFTGSGEFNESLRSICKKKNITINEYFILKNGVKYYPKSEKQIFDILKLRYISPPNRLSKNIVFA